MTLFFATRPLLLRRRKRRCNAILRAPRHFFIPACAPDPQSRSKRLRLMTLFFATRPLLLRRRKRRCNAILRAPRHFFIPACAPDPQSRPIGGTHAPDLLGSNPARRIKCRQIKERVTLNQFFTVSSAAAGFSPIQSASLLPSALISIMSSSLPTVSMGSTTPSAACSSGSCSAGQQS